MNSDQSSAKRRIQNIQSHIVAGAKKESNKSSSNDLYDCIVVGGGIIGSSACYQIAKDGLKVLMLEQFKQSHDYGSSHGDGRIIRFSYPETVYIELAKLAYPFWNDIEKESNTKLLHTTGGLDFGTKDHQALLDLIDSYKRHNIPYEILNKKDAEVRFPQFEFKEDDLIIFQKDSGVLYATKAVNSMYALAKRFGATVKDSKKVLRIKVESRDLITVLCEDQSVYKTKKIVLACGGWTNELLYRSQLDLTLPVEITQEKVFYWVPKENEKASSIDFTQYKNPVSIYYDKEEIFYSLPQIDIRGVKIGYHHSGSVLHKMADNHDNKPVYNENSLNKLKKFVKNYMPNLNNEKEFHSVTCHYTNTPDWHFIIDKHPRFSNIVIASTCSGHGFKFAPAIGKLLCFLVRDKEIPFPTDEFLLNRFKNKGFVKRISA
ncbi:hypothetical protein DICPUDRAFT_97844 [Dictyostelium purpureum]|uniref:FAD dependent oxidoreductase domain-containing protein n=1 Tax=Dictyostelium purpureum TaxID=5786 RepID=F0ZKB6_DICPU|nr:uncharacterized protein DICPUDRAFT_97844 [Dictyostelium purpureum]EGC35616.1 hypothetical protein DICPUDRAFT_97844 [Dictyostelium purpureum]|eukprot:XP_003287853.1 hypothetical protein DICPUDRAFT_97844 [Dictyostelium purpureum]